MVKDHFIVSYLHKYFTCQAHSSTFTQLYEMYKQNKMQC